jgi:putative methanogen marker protein 4
MLDIENLLALARTSKGQIGIGLRARPDVIDESIRMARQQGLPEVIAYDDAQKLCTDLRDRKICAAVRGTLPSGEVLAAIKETYGIQRVLRVALLSTSNGKQFFLAPVGIDEGNSLEERFELMKQGVRYLKCLGVEAIVAVLSKGRVEDGNRGDEIARSLDEGDRLTEMAIKAGISAKHEHILIEKAVQEADFVLAPDGASGNLIFRSLYFLGGGGAIGAPVVNIGKIFVDTSRDKLNYADSIGLAAALCAARARTQARIRK